MLRKKQKTIYANQQPNKIEPRPISRSFVPQNPITNKFSNLHVPDSLQRFQWELQSSLIHQRQMRLLTEQNQRKHKRRVTTQYIDSQEEVQFQKIGPNKISKLQRQVEELKNELISNKNNGLEDKLDKLLEEMVKSREADREFFKQQRNSTSSQPPIPNNIFYPPMPYQPNMYDQRQQMPREKYDRTTSTFKKSQKIQSRKKTPKRILRKYFYVVLFTKFLKKQAQSLAKLRKQNLRKFFVDKFDSQMLNLKNWLVETHGYAFPVILQKQEINLEFWMQKREAIERQKQSLVLSLIKLGLQKMKKDCTAPKITMFSQILYNLCIKGSFVMSRFWSAYQMENICISEFYGCIRAQDSLEKYLICMVVFVKMLVFNMFLQPQKFDNINFPKSKKTLTKNMYILGSVYYKLAKEVLKEYLEQSRPQYFKLGNWLKVKQQFIVQCCEPLKFNCDYPEEGEYISGLIGSQLEILEMKNEWNELKQKIQQIISILHRQLLKRRKDTIRSQKFKLYN